MIYPTPRAVALAAAGAPVALVAGAAGPGLWLVGPAWVLLTAGALLVDVLFAPSQVELELTTPGALGVGAVGEGALTAVFAAAAPRRVEMALGVNDRLQASLGRRVAEVRGGRARTGLTLTPRRRGEAVFEAAWARWRGPLGLAWIQRVRRFDRKAPVTPDIQGVKKEALRLFARDAAFGVKAQIEMGEGTEFHALKEFATGMEPRSIDWKQSARHGRLLSKEHRTERNHQIILALDTGRLMSAPVGGVPRIDRAINAALLLAFVSLKLGDKVGLFAFDARPRVSSGPASGAGAFPLLQRLAAGIDYSTEETNFTLGLATLSGQLERRAMIVVFADFADPTSAELMLDNVARLVRTHLVLFVVFREEALERIAQAEPTVPEDVSRAVVAGTLLQQREAVIGRLRRLGVQIVDAPADQVGVELVNRYLDSKRRSLV
jgi:uncharacterized protein (DUF58 family)